MVCIIWHDLISIINNIMQPHLELCDWLVHCANDDSRGSWGVYMYWVEIGLRPSRKSCKVRRIAQCLFRNLQLELIYYLHEVRYRCNISCNWIVSCDIPGQMDLKSCYSRMQLVTYNEIWRPFWIPRWRINTHTLNSALTLAD